MKFFQTLIVLSLIIFTSCGIEGKKGTLVNIQENAVTIKENYDADFLEWLSMRSKVDAISMSTYTFDQLHEQFAWERYKRKVRASEFENKYFEHLAVNIQDSIRVYKSKDEEEYKKQLGYYEINLPYLDSIEVQLTNYGTKFNDYNVWDHKDIIVFDIVNHSEVELTAIQFEGTANKGDFQSILEKARTLKKIKIEPKKGYYYTFDQNGTGNMRTSFKEQDDLTKKYNPRYHVKEAVLGGVYVSTEEPVNTHSQLKAFVENYYMNNDEII